MTSWIAPASPLAFGIKDKAMKITLTPQAAFKTLSVTKQGDTLTFNDDAYDFSVIPDGGTLPKDACDCEWLASDVQRIGGKLHLSIRLPVNEASSEAARFPEPIIDPKDGPLELPT